MQIKTKRDYLEGRHRTNWFYMSRLAALKEFSYMQVCPACCSGPDSQWRLAGTI